MVKKRPDPSLKGKKPVNAAPGRKNVPIRRNPGHIKNRLKRSEVYGKYLQQKRQQKLTARREAALGEDVSIKKAPKTIDSTREVEATLVNDEDKEIIDDEMDDEFAQYFTAQETPKVLITTRPRPSQQLFYFIADLQTLIPGLHFYPRQSFSVHEICTFAANRDFTHVMILSEKQKVCNGLLVTHVRRHEGVGIAGPTAYFKVSHVVTRKKLPRHGAPTSHTAELNVHGFCTRLGRRIGRVLASLFPSTPQFEGRQVVTLHNQRDYIFVRQHRYIFDHNEKIHARLQQQAEATAKKKEADGTKAADGTKTESIPKYAVKTRLQELGPRFTLKLRWLQAGGLCDGAVSEYEWYHKRHEMDTSRRKFHL